MPWGLLVGASRGCRCAMGIAVGCVAWVPLCHGDRCWARRVGGAVSSRLLTEPFVWVAPCLWIADQGVVWVAPCLWDC